MARGDAVIAISQFMEAHVKTHYPWARTTLIYEGIDTDFFVPISSPLTAEKRLPLLFVPSRQSPLKGVETVLFALEKLSMPCELLLIETGKTSTIATIKHVIKDLSLGNRVKWIPAQEDLSSFYAMCDVVVVPSTVPEALGRVNLEALSMEKLLLSSHLGANTESCLDHVTGRIFCASDSDDLAQKIEEILTLPEEEKTRLRQQGRALVLHQFSHKKMIKKTIALYKRLSKHT